MSGDETSGHLVWVTNLPSPYRFPVWAALAPVDVICLARSEPGRHWDAPDQPARGVRIHYPTVPRAARAASEANIYLPSRHLQRTLSALTQNARAVIIGNWESPAYWQSLHVARRHGRPAVAFYESTTGSHRFHRGPIAAVRRLFFRSAGAVLCAGVACSETVLAMGVPRQRVVTMFNPVEMHAIRDYLGEAVRAPAAAAGHRFLYTGQLIERKNVGMLLHSFLRMAVPEDTLDVVGDGPLRGNLERLAAQLGLAGQVRFFGHLVGEALLQRYAQSQTLVLPSRQEVWGLVANEALAAGLQAVISSSAGVAPAVRGMRGVVVVDPNLQELTAGMVAARAAWSGYITEPEILRYGPQQAAAAAESAVAIAAAALGTGSGREKVK